MLASVLGPNRALTSAKTASSSLPRCRAGKTGSLPLRQAALSAVGVGASPARTKARTPSARHGLPTKSTAHSRVRAVGLPQKPVAARPVAHRARRWGLWAGESAVIPTGRRLGALWSALPNRLSLRQSVCAPLRRGLAPQSPALLGTPTHPAVPAFNDIFRDQGISAVIVICVNMPIHGAGVFASADTAAQHNPLPAYGHRASCGSGRRRATSGRRAA